MNFCPGPQELYNSKHTEMNLMKYKLIYMQIYPENTIKFGYVNLVDWNGGMEWWSGLLEWSIGLDYQSATPTSIQLAWFVMAQIEISSETVVRH